MANQMTLNLTLKGVSQMIQSIQALNAALRRLDNGFASAANRISNASTQIQKAVQSLRPPPVRSGGGGRGAGRPSNSNNPNINEVVPFATQGIMGNFQALFASAVARVIGDAFKKWLQNHKLNPQSPSNQNQIAMPINAPSRWASFLSNFRLGILGLAAGVTLLIAGIAILLKSIQSASEAFKSIAHLYYSSGGRESDARRLRNLGASLNIPNDEIASAASGKSGFGYQLIEEIKALRSINDDRAAAQFARSRGLERFLPVRDLSDSEFKKAISPTGDNDGAFNRFVSGQFQLSVGQFKLAIENLLISMSPIILLFSHGVQNFTLAINLFNAGVSLIHQLLSKIFNVADKMDNAANKFNDGIDKFSDKLGTFGGGQRAQNPVPKAWRFYGNQQELIERARDLGAFSF